MEWFKTKKELLKRLWKDEKDSRWIDRAIARGEVIKREEGLCIGKEYIEYLEEKTSCGVWIVDNNPVAKASVNMDDLEYQIQENERLEWENAELIEWIKRSFIYFWRGWQRIDYINKIWVSSLLEDMEFDE
jgi:hypothetical protein